MRTTAATRAVNSFSLITSYIVRLVDMTLPLLPDPIGYEQIDASPKFALTPIRPSPPPITYEEEDSDDEADYDSEDDTEEVEFIPVTVVVVPIIPPPSRAQLEWNTLMKCPSWDQLLTYRVRDPGVLVQYTRLRSSRRKDPVHVESGRGRLNRAGSMLVAVLNRSTGLSTHSFPPPDLSAKSLRRLSTPIRQALRRLVEPRSQSFVKRPSTLSNLLVFPLSTSTPSSLRSTRSTNKQSPRAHSYYSKVSIKRRRYFSYTRGGQGDRIQRSDSGDGRGRKRSRDGGRRKERGRSLVR